MVRSLKFDVFGRQVLITASENGWKAFYVGHEGKRRVATDISIPPDIPETEIERYLGDLCHEWATEHHTDVRRLD